MLFVYQNTFSEETRPMTTENGGTGQSKTICTGLLSDPVYSSLFVKVSCIKAHNHLMQK